VKEVYQSSGTFEIPVTLFGGPCLPTSTYNTNALEFKYEFPKALKTITVTTKKIAWAAVILRKMA
jgi:hypothetical protein